jgi:hypothetical protein
LGVLGWCAEFGELIDNLRDLGFSGNMFVTTRSQALRACEEIVQLKLEEVKMQLIMMFLSSQVARLRRFLDPDRVWTDYPEIHFPLEAREVVCTSFKFVLFNSISVFCSHYFFCI